MTTEQAFQLVDRAISGIPCSRSQHVQLNQALQLLFNEAMKPKAKVEMKKPEAVPKEEPQPAAVEKAAD